MNARIEITVNPGENERSAILKPLRAHNFSKAGDPKSESIALLVRDEQTNDIIGGFTVRYFIVGYLSSC